MKLALAAAAVVAFSASSAFAQCADKYVSASVEKPMTLASADVATTPQTDAVTTGSVAKDK